VVVFVPSFYVVMQWLDERRTRKPAPHASAPLAQPKDASGSSAV
jgi:hypothetical protein